MYVLTFKVRELLICVLLMFIDLFIDWGNPSSNLSDYIKTFGEFQLPGADFTKGLRPYLDLNLRLLS